MKHPDNDTHGAHIQPGVAAFTALLLVFSALVCTVTVLAETWEEAAIRLERSEKQAKVNAASRDLFYAITQSDKDRAALAIALGADVNQCVAYTDARRRNCLSRMLDYAVQLYNPGEDDDGGQKALEVIRLLLRKGALLVDDDVLQKIRNPMSLRKIFDKESLLLLMLESGYRVTPDLLAVAAQYRNPEGYRTSYPLQLLLQKSHYGVRSTFRASDFGADINKQVIRHIHGLDHLDRPLESTSDLTDITLLHLAAVTGNTEVASYLIRQGTDLHARTSNGADALEVAWSLWIYTWNESVWGEDYSFDLANFLEFIRLLVLHGMDTEEAQLHYLEHRDIYQEIFVANCQYSPVDLPGGENVTLKEFFDRHFTNTSWKLVKFDVLDTKARDLCTIVVNFKGTSLDGRSHYTIPMVFIDNVLFVAGNEVKDVRFPVTVDGRRLRPGQILDFWHSLGLNVAYENETEQ